MARQAWNRNEELDRAVLEHVRATLLVLAALVERAAGLPPLARLHFRAVMAGGEADLRRLIAAMAFDRGPGNPAGAAAPATADLYPSPPAMASGDTALLAARFRMLALAVDAVLARAGGRSPRRHVSPSLSLSRRSLPASQFTPSPALRATSPPQAGQRSLGVGDDTHAANGRMALRSPLAFVFRTGGVGAPLPRPGGEVARRTGQGVLALLQT